MSDLIDREATIDYLTTNMGYHDEEGHRIEDWDERREIIASLIEGIPSAEPEQKTGKWVKADSQQYFRKHHSAYTCSMCGYKKGGAWKYCPNCGARMVKQ